MKNYRPHIATHCDAYRLKLHGPCSSIVFLLPGCEHFLSHAELKLQEHQNTIVAASVACSSHAVLMMAMIEEEENDDDDEEEEP